ncbi:MAG: hypothetical protein LBL26_03870 [Peptococcaceae bacterium]|nr:hypothetical protein [Peptococcaceae bacterium]
MSIIPQKQTADSSSIGKGAFRNWGIWIAGIIVSILPLLVVPFVRFLTQNGYSSWFVDIFNNSEAIMVAISMAVAALFEFFTKNQNKPRLIYFFGIALLLLTLFCVGAYGIVEGITEYAAITGNGNAPSFNLAPMNIAFLCMMFALGSLSFVSGKEY